MPFFNLNTYNLAYKREDFDFTIIGAGIAGILLAVKLTERGKKVLILETGHFEEDGNRQVLNEVIQTGKTLVNAVWGRKRAIGGTSIAWGGQSLPFSPVDFKERAWVKGSGWPISYEDLKSYYLLANQFLKIDELDYEQEILDLLGMKTIPIDQQLLHYHFSKWAPQPNLRKLYENILDKKIITIYNAVVTKININENGKADTLTVKNFNQKQFLLPVNQVLVATGTIEAYRLLAASNNKIASGLGNHSGWLGKCFMEHPCIEIGYVETNDSYQLQKHFNTHLYNNRKYSLRLTLSERAQEEYKLLNASSGIMFFYDNEAFDPYVEVRKFLQEKNIKYLQYFLNKKNISTYFLSTKAFFFDRLIYKHNAKAKLVMMLEQEPLVSSYLKLSDEKDLMDMRKVIINWDVSYKTWDTAVRKMHFVKNELSRLSLGTLHPHKYVDFQNENWKSNLSDVNHHMGGTKMSSTPGEGVVNSYLQVWGHPNIYICSCSVFPTSSHSNPTLTMMALCLRLLENLSK